MAVEGLNARETLMVFLGAAITILLIKSAVYLSNHNYRLGALYLVMGSGLAFLFFRKRRVIFSIIVLVFILVNVGLTAIFHPSVVGALVTLGSAGGLYFIIRRGVREYPNRTRKDMHKLFDKDPES